MTGLKIDGLEKLLKMLKSKNHPFIRIGILGENASADHADKNGKSSGVTNSEIGAAHEYGTSKLPIRSWLRMPLTLKLNERLKESGALSERAFREVMESGTIYPWLDKVQIVAESVVGDAFDTGGFGTWKISDYSRKENDQTLVETQQLRNSVTSVIIKKGGSD